jgi:hypothetical protein
MSGNVPNVPQNPYLESEFEEFLSNIGNSNLKNWSLVAEALGVSRKTISRWKKHPVAKTAIAKAISENVSRMEKVGRGDWRMYREKLRMFGISDKQEVKQEIVEDNEIEHLLDSLERTNYAELGRRAKEEMDRIALNSTRAA